MQAPIMAAAPLPRPWLPEDDFLLKSSVEAGASLEALAKGAVQFSRRFTVRELRERWHSLLYASDISAEASVCMLEYERSTHNLCSKVNISGNSKEKMHVLGKRKGQSIRSLYYAMRKKFHAEALNCGNIFSPAVPYSHDCISDIDGCPKCIPSNHEPQNGGFMLGDGMADQYRLQKTSFDMLQHPFPQIRRDFPASDSITYSGKLSPSEMLRKENIFELSNDVSPMPMQQLVSNNSRHSFDELIEDDKHKDGLISVSEGDFVDLPESLLDFENENELIFIDNDAKSIENMPPHDNLTVLLSSCPKDNSEGELPGLASHNPSASPHPVKISEIPDVACSEKLDCLSPSHSAQHQIDVSVTDATQVSKSVSTELCTKFMYCTLNTEDPDIPDYANAVFPPQNTTQFASALPKSKGKESGKPAAFTGIKKDSIHGKPLTNKKEFPASKPKLTGSKSSPQIALANERIVSEVKSTKTLTAVPNDSDNNRQVLSKCSAPQETIKHNKQGDLKVTQLKTEVTNAQAALVDHRKLPPDQAISKKAFEEQKEILVTSDQEEYDSDTDIPYFSDIESMILDMDLVPGGEDSYISDKVSKYQNEGAQRRIMRLEQSAHSSLQRAIVSGGAFAILTGRHSKYFIKKSEVILGRATNDFDVDIDLGREGQANKISRRQAILKLEKDKSFWLKNVGRNSIFVNGTEVATGQLLSLNAGCLIEIRGLSFVLEVNHKLVNQYLARIVERTEERHLALEWLPQGGPS